MKWSLIVCLFLCLMTYSEGGALRCPPGVLDPSCNEEREELESKESPSSGPVEVQCQVGSEWESNCHYCRCSDSGVAECLKQAACDKGVFAEPMLCKPNTTFQRDCNTCVCLENGLGLCTLEFCRRSAIPRSNLELTEENEKESELKSSRNEVVASLTRNYPNEIKFLDSDHDMLKESICKPHEEFMRDCNPCKCAADGLSYTCTKNECLDVDMDKEVEVFMHNEGTDHIERHSVCRARNTFYIGCNTCRCNQLGTDYACTNKPCPLPADVELFVQPKTTESSKNVTKAIVCEANRMFVKDCNTCWCNEDGTSFSCTRKVCVPLLPDDQPGFGGIPAEDLRVTIKECRPNEIFELDCNMCHCNSDGKSYACTRRACEGNGNSKNVNLSRKVRSFTTELPKTCQPGQEFRMDCNKCLCDNRGHDFSCTRIDCNHPEGGSRSKREVSDPIEMKCSPGSVFDRDCNVCRCTSDGNHATCTLKRCTQNNNQDNEVHTPDSDLGFRCNPGEQFKRDCNDCTCSADGKSIFCTLVVCDQNIASDI